jgi:rfaE bifunctional protein nucleotidyltransferase chain/domain
MRVWSNGCFDLFHYGHLKMLEFASEHGDELFVGIDSDNKVKQSKGNHRPFVPQNQRAELIENIKFVDKVFVFDSQKELKDIIKNNDIDIIVIGNDYIDKHVVGEEYVKQVVFFPKLQNISTSSLEKRIIDIYIKQSELNEN